MEDKKYKSDKLYIGVINYPNNPDIFRIVEPVSKLGRLLINKEIRNKNKNIDLPIVNCYEGILNGEQYAETIDPLNKVETIAYVYNLNRFISMHKDELKAENNIINNEYTLEELRTLESSINEDMLLNDEILDDMM